MLFPTYGFDQHLRLWCRALECADGRVGSPRRFGCLPGAPQPIPTCIALIVRQGFSSGWDKFSPVYLPRSLCGWSDGACFSLGGRCGFERGHRFELSQRSSFGVTTSRISQSRFSCWILQRQFAFWHHPLGPETADLSAEWCSKSFPRIINNYLRRRCAQGREKLGLKISLQPEPSRCFLPTLMRDFPINIR